MTKRKVEAYEGSGNIFADLGLPNPEERLLNAGIVAQLHRLIKQRALRSSFATVFLSIMKMKWHSSTSREGETARTAGTLSAYLPRIVVMPSTRILAERMRAGVEGSLCAGLHQRPCL
jgi:hypothetical protein